MDSADLAVSVAVVPVAAAGRLDVVAVVDGADSADSGAAAKAPGR